MKLKVNNSNNTLNGTIEIPADKSISHRAIIFSSLAKGKSNIKNFSNGQDPYSTLKVFQNLGVEIQRAKNKHKVRSIVYLFICIANIFVSIPCIKTWGASGAAFGTAISLTAGNIIFMNIYYHKAIGIDIIKFWKSISRFIPALIPTIICGLIIDKFIPLNNSWFTLGISIITYCIVYMFSMWFLGMNIEEKQLLSAPFQKIFKKIRG